MFMMMDSVLVVLVTTLAMMMIRNVVILVPAAAKTKSKHIRTTPRYLVVVVMLSFSLSRVRVLSFQSALVVYLLE